jgi:prepilin-type N-terminal cleavage/methylation domain-containing protein
VLIKVRMNIAAEGTTLIELLVVLTIMGILVFLLGFSFQDWTGNYKVESQAKEMYVDLMNARARAMQRNRCHFVVVTANNYQIFEDANEDCVYNAGDTALTAFTSPKTLTYTSNWTGTVTMDTRGMVNQNDTIRFDNLGKNPDYDCITIYSTRINMGKWNGSSCDAK